MRQADRPTSLNAAAAVRSSDKELEQLHQDALDASKDKARVYEKWATNYDTHVESMQYAGPSIVAARVVSHCADAKETRIKVLDAACGTGLVGKELAKNVDSSKQWSLHGCDLSDHMLEGAAPYYETLRRVDMNKSLAQYPKDEFDAVTCVGAFLEGHVFPNPALREFLRITKPGGVMLLTVRETFYESHFKAPLENLNEVADISVEQIPYLTGLKAKLVTIRKHKAQKRETAHHIAMLGIGRMGSAMVKLFLAQGYTVYMYDRYADSLAYTTKEEMEELGGTWKDTAQDAVKNADFVISNLPLPRDVQEVMAGSGNAIASMKPGSVWADFSTTDYHVTIKLAELCKSHNVLPLEIPVSNLHQLGVDVGNASFYAAGSREGYAKVIDDMDVISAKSFFVSTEIGKAQTVKLLTNLMFYLATAISGEALAICKLAGIPPHYTWRFLEKGTSMSATMRHFVPCLLDGSYDRSCTLEVVIKDVNLTMELDKEFRANGSKHSAGRVLPATLNLFNRIATVYDEKELANLNHLLVNTTTAKDNGVSLQEENWTSPSPHGVDKTYQHSTYYCDSMGRKQPVIPENYLSTTFSPSTEQQSLLDTVCEWVTYTNFLAYLDAEALGLGMGLDPHEFITWSVGACWVSDNLRLYNSDFCKDAVEKLPKIRAALAGAKLMVSEEILDTIETMAATDLAMLAPVCDVSRLVSPHPVYLDTLAFEKLKEGDEVEVGRMVDALKTNGIAFLDGFMNFPKDAVHACQNFFALPLKTKNRYSRDVQTVFPATSRGYVPINGEMLDAGGKGPDFKELFDLGLEAQEQPDDAMSSPFMGPTVIPDDTVAPHFADSLHKLQRKVMQEAVPVIVSALDSFFDTSAENRMETLMDTPTLIQRAIHYPAYSQAFAGMHTDGGIFTILFFANDAPQVCVNGEWRRIHNNPGIPVLFAGDLLEHWTGGEIISAPHRVLVTGDARGRISLPFFVYPNVHHSVTNIKTGESFSTKKHMLRNFEGIWDKGEGAGQSRTFREH